MDIKEKNNLLKYQEGNEFNKIIKKKQFQLLIPELKCDDIILSQEQIKKGAWISRMSMCFNRWRWTGIWIGKL